MAAEHYQATFVATAASPADTLRVKIPGFDNGVGTFVVTWSPLGNALPAAGDHALVVEADDGTWWAVAWWSAAQTVPAADLSARVFNSANLTLVNNTLTRLTFNSERWDNGVLHSTVTNTGRLTCPAGGDGIYNIGCCVDFVSNATGYRQVGVLLNNAAFIVLDGRAPASGQETTVPLATLYALAAGDFVEVWARQTSGGNLDVVATASSSPEFWMRREG